MAIERFQGSEPQKQKELSPRSGILDALKGTISERVTTISRKPGEKGKTVSVNLVQEGSGQFELTDIKDNRAWADVFDRSLRIGRIAVNFAERMQASGHETHPQTILDTAIVSPAGIRTKIEALYYPEAVPHAKEKKVKSSQTLGLEIIQNKVPQDVFNLAAGISHEAEQFSVDPQIYESWDYKITTYVAHRTSQEYGLLPREMGKILIVHFLEEDPKDNDIAHQITYQLFRIIDRHKGKVLGNINANPISLDEADEILAKLGAPKQSTGGISRKDFAQLLLNDAETEAEMTKAGIHPNAVSEKIIPIPAWEEDLRLQYVEAAEPDILAEIFSLEHQAKKGNTNASQRLGKEFLGKDWWSTNARRLFEEWKGGKIDTASPVFSSRITNKHNKRAKPILTIHPDEKYL